jgi:hypothetical protein
MSKKYSEATSAPASRAVPASALMAIVSLLGILLVVPQDASAKVKSFFEAFFKYD